MIPRYRTILYTTDLTDNASHAFRHAVVVARCHEARIHILHVMPEMDSSIINYVATVMGEDKLADLELKHEEEVAQRIRERLDNFAREELQDHPEDLERVAGIEVHHGNPVAAILAAADRLEADLVVMGSHGKGTLQYAFLGSVAEKVLRKTHRPVLVIPLRGE